MISLSYLHPSLRKEIRLCTVVENLDCQQKMCSSDIHMIFIGHKVYKEQISEVFSHF